MQRFVNSVDLEKLEQICSLGFDDVSANREALIDANGDVHRAVAILLGCEDLI